MISASQTGHALGFTYDALGRNLTQTGPHGTVTSTWDIGGRRTRITHADGFYVDQDFLVTGEVTKIRENGATSGVGVLAAFAYDDLGRRVSLTRGNGTVTSYGYDPASRLASLADDFNGTNADQNVTFAYNPVSQIVTRSGSNDAYAWTGHRNGTTSATANGLNQLITIGGASTSHDARGNMTADGLGGTFGYSSENLLTSASGSVTLGYDPATRLYQVAGAATTRFGYDGADPIAEYDGSNALQRRFVHGPDLDEPLVWYEGSGTTDRRFLHADERGSIVAVSNNSGAVTSVNTYDEYGRPGSGNAGRFQYTGQKWIAELGLYDYKARFYHAALGRFLQTDPIGYGSGMNIYLYARADPVGRVDPTGLESGDEFGNDGDPCGPQAIRCWDVRATAPRYNPNFVYLDASGTSHAIYLGDDNLTNEEKDKVLYLWAADIVITANKRNKASSITIDWARVFPQEEIWLVTRSRGLIYIPTRVVRVVNRGTKSTTIVGAALGVYIPPDSDIIAEIHTHPLDSEWFPEFKDYGKPFPVFGIHLATSIRWVVLPGAQRGSQPLILPKGKTR